jgi:hypothetical protein
MLPRSFFFAVLAGFYPRRATRAGLIFSREPNFCEEERERGKRKKKKEFVRNENTCLVDDDVSIFDLVFFLLCVCVCVDSLLLTFTSSI